MQTKIPLLPFMALACELVALAMVTLVLVSPAPFEHCGISLLTIVPQPALQNTTTASSLYGNATNTSSSAVLPTATQTTALNSTRKGQAASNNATTSNQGSTGRIGEAGTAMTAASSTNGNAAEKTETSPVAETETSSPTPEATTAPSSSIRRRARVFPRQNINSTVTSTATSAAQSGSANSSTAASSAQQTAQGQSRLRLRLGPLGSCYRSIDGKTETCSPALLHPKYDYTRLLNALNAAMPSSTNGSTTATLSRRQVVIDKPDTATVSATSATASMGAAAAVATLPTSLTSFPTILLLIVICVACIAGLWTVQGFLMLQALRKGKLAGIQICLTPAWSTIGRGTSLGTVIATAVLLVATGISKYSMSQAKNAFNSSQPVTYGMSTGASTASGALVPLVADTGNGYGFIWISCLLLFASFWLRRTWIRRQRAQALQNASGVKQDDEQAGKTSTNDQDNKGSQPISILMKQPSSKSIGKPSVIEMQPSSSTVDVHHYAYDYGPEKTLKHKESLPSLYTPFAWHEDHLAKNSPPPFSNCMQVPRPAYEYGASLYHGEQASQSHGHAPGQKMCVACGDLSQGQTLDPGHGSRYVSDTSRDLEIQPQLQPSFSVGASTMPYRSASPAPTYWTAEDRELERQYMASMRRRREAEAQAARLAGASSSCGHR